MRCWKCKQEMPEGLKYCGNCGVHMNRAVHTIQWLFSKKGLPVLILLLALLIGAAAWLVVKYVDFPQPELDLDLPVIDNPIDREDPPEKMYDFGLYPDELSFIVGNTLDGGLFQNQDKYFYAEGAMINFSMVYNEETKLHDYVLHGEHPHWWSHHIFIPELEDEVADYLELLYEKPFYFELVHQQSYQGDEAYDSLPHLYYHNVGEYYFYHYTGVQNTFGLVLPEWVDADPEELEEVNLIIRILEDEDGIHFEVWQDLGLESVYREEMEDILNDVPYHRTVESQIVTEESSK